MADDGWIERTVTTRPTLVVAARTTWAEFPTLWRPLLDEVWGCVRAAGLTGGCPTVMLYLDDAPQVEIGVLTTEPVPLTGRVVRSSLPAGAVAPTPVSATLTGPCAGGPARTAGRWPAHGGRSTARIGRTRPSSRCR